MGFVFLSSWRKFRAYSPLETEGDESKPVSQPVDGRRLRKKERKRKESGEVESRRNTFLSCLLALEMQRRLEEPRRFSNLERKRERGREIERERQTEGGRERE